MIVNMACPNCGKQATEYDEHKWTCLHCGNKFIYAPIAPPQTHNYVQNTVNIVGQPTYDLDTTNAKPSKPIIKTRLSHSPEEFQYDQSFIESRDHAFKFLEDSRKRRNSNQVWMVVCLVLFVFSSIIAMAAPIYWVGAFVSLMFFLLNLVLFGNGNSVVGRAQAHLESEEQNLAEREARRNEKITVGYQPVCPFCLVDVFVASVGLTHCPKCGKQFHYSNERSYPVKFK